MRSRCLLGLGVSCLVLGCSSGGGGTTGSTSISTTGASGASGSGTNATTSGGSGGATGTSGSSSGESAATLIGQIVQAECAYESQCGLAAAYLQPQCPSLVAPEFDSILAAVDAGLVAYDSSEAPACLGAVLDAGCAGLDETLAPCAEVFTGTVVGGGACYTDNDCLHGSCSGSGVCPSNCVPYAELGQSCVSLTCDSSNGLSCQALSDGGQACEPSVVVDAGLGGSCSSNCDLGLYCEASANPTCVMQVEDGGSCAGYFGECANQEICAGGPSDGPQSGSDATGFCLPGGDVGASCTLTGSGLTTLNSGCLNGLACVPSGNGASCQIPPMSGACAVDANAPCYSYGYFCEQSSDTCQPRQPAGAVCDPTLFGQDCLTSECASDAIGDGGVCSSGCVPP